MAMAGLAVPVLIHLLSRYRSRQMEWAAMELLKRAMVVRSKRLRLEDLLLLALRCLAAILIALALCRPYFKQAGSSGSGEGASGVLIAVDGSFSMSYKPGQTSRFKDGVKRVQDILATVKPGSPVTLAVMGARVHVLVRDKAYDPEAFKEELSRLAPLPESLDLETCLREIDTMVRETKAASHECFIVTDAQAVTWAKVSDTVNTRLQSLREFCRVFLLPAGTIEAENLAITRLAVSSGVLRANTTALYTAEVANMGMETSHNVKVQLFLSAPGTGGKEVKVPLAGARAVSTDTLGVLKDERLVDRIMAKATVAVSLFVRFEKPGLYVLTARITREGQGLAGDGLPLDDVRYAVADVRGVVNVLCVDGDPSPEPFRGETDFLSAALACLSPVADPAVGGGSGLTVDTVPLGGFEASRLGNYDVVFLANVPELDKFRLLAVDEFVRRGGGLVVFLGDKVIPATANAQWAVRGGSALLPAKIGPRQQMKVKGSDADRTARGDKSGSLEGWVLDADIPYHPITGIFHSMRRELWSGIRFREYFKVLPNAGAQTLLRVANGDPLLVEQGLGRGRVLLFTSTANRKWNDLVVYPAYLMMMQQAVTHLTRKAHEAPYLVAERLVLDLPLEAPAKVTVSAGEPAEAPVELTKIDVSDRDAQKVADAGPAARAGIYTVSWPQCPAPLKAAVNVDPRESDLAVLRAGKLADVSKLLSVRLIDEKDDIQIAVRESRKGREVWFTLLMIALAALAVEAVLGKMFSRRMSHGSQGPSTAPEALL